MKIAILTSSRADYSIYYPLIKKLIEAAYDVRILAFGSHLSEKYGNTIEVIKNDGFNIDLEQDTTPKEDTPMGVCNAMAYTLATFADFWKNNSYDLIFALGDRYEMFSAVSAAFTYNLKIAHISGGEVTLGAFDNAFRHSISLMSSFHFVSTSQYRQRLLELLDDKKNIYNVGALNIDTYSKVKVMSIEEFKAKWDIDLTLPTILVTLHPETASIDQNTVYLNVFVKALTRLVNDYQIVITMPNSDPMGDVIRNEWERFGSRYDSVKIVESFGMKGYLSCMKYCQFMLGNTSSGFVEASYFPTKVINVGDRQKGRLLTSNILNVSFDEDEIISAVDEVINMSLENYEGVYGDGNAAEKIVEILKKNYKDE